MGIEGEKAPHDTIILIIDSSVQIIREKSFEWCRSIQKCFINNGVEVIGDNAFRGCSSLEVIMLPKTLKSIGQKAFCYCKSLEALLIPSSIGKIGNEAFGYCKKLRILSLPPMISVSQIGYWGVSHCDTFFETTQIQREQYLRYYYNSNQTEEVHQSILNFYHNLPPLHKACLDTNVTAQTITDCIDEYGLGAATITDHDGMTPLHILAINPHANGGAIFTCFNANMGALFTGDNRNKTPLDYLVVHHDLEVYFSFISALCISVHKDRCETSHHKHSPPTVMSDS